MNAPNKVYMSPLEIFYKGDRQQESDVEYVRTDVFIEKACEWLKNSTYGYLTEKWGETDIDRETLALDFKNYMNKL